MTDAVDASESPKRVMKRRRKRVWILLVVLPIVLLGLDQAWVAWDRRILVGHDTTRITVPMLDGYPDYLGAINDEGRSGISPENNGAPILLEAITGQGLSEEWTRCVYKEWGIAPAKGGDGFETYYDWLAKEITKGKAATKNFFQARDQFFDADRQQWSEAEHPDLARWIESCAPAIGKLEEACAKPRFFMPLITQGGLSHDAANMAFIHIDDAWIDQAHNLSRAVIVRSMLRLQRRDWDGFEHDVELVGRLSRTLSEQPTLRQRMIASEMDEDTTLALQDAIRSGGMDKARADALRAGMERLGPMPSLAEAWDKGERYAVLDVVCAANRTGYSPGYTRTAFQAVWFRFYAVNYSQIMRDDNAFFDELVKAFSVPDYQRRQSEIKKLEQDVRGMAESGTWHKLTHPGEVFLTLLLPSASAVDGAQTKRDAERALAITGLALRAARERSGRYPETLGELKGFDVLQDPFNQKTLVYRRKDDGFILYSVGPNLADDGGATKGSKYDVALEVKK